MTVPTPASIDGGIAGDVDGAEGGLVDPGVALVEQTLAGQPVEGGAAVGDEVFGAGEHRRRDLIRSSPCRPRTAARPRVATSAGSSEKPS